MIYINDDRNLAIHCYDLYGKYQNPIFPPLRFEDFVVTQSNEIIAFTNKKINIINNQEEHFDIYIIDSMMNISGRQFAYEVDKYIGEDRGSRYRIEVDQVFVYTHHQADFTIKIILTILFINTKRINLYQRLFLIMVS